MAITSRIAGRLAVALALVAAPISMSAQKPAPAPPASGSDPQFKVRLDFNRWHDHAELKSDFLRLEKAWPKFLKYSSLGLSHGKREIMMLTINNPDTGAETTKPAMYIEANVHGNEIQGGEVVFIPDAANDPMLKHVKGELQTRRVKSITVVPITWRGVAIGAIFLRAFRDGPTFSDEDVRFVQVVASLTAQALRNAHRYERLAQRRQQTTEQLRRMELERVALLGFLRRLLDAFGQHEGAWAEGLLPKAGAEELDRLVGVALAVIQEEAKGR